MKRFYSFLFVLLIVCVQAFAETYTISFKSNAGADNSSTVSLVEEIVDDGADLLSSLAAANVYLGKSGYGIKFGTSTKKGELTLQLREVYQPTRLVFRAAVWSGASGSDSDVIEFNGLQVQLKGGTTLTDYTVEMDGGTEMQTIVVAGAKASKNRFYLKSITIEAPDPSPGVSEIRAPKNVFFGNLIPVDGVATAEQTIKVSGKNLNSNIAVALSGNEAFKLESAASLPTQGGEVKISCRLTAEGCYRATLNLLSRGAKGIVSEQLNVSALMLSHPLHAGTAEDPYSVTDALIAAAALKDGEPTTDYFYVEGVVRGTASASQGEVDMLIADDYSEIKVYKMMANSDELLEADMFNEGDSVLILTRLYKYRGTCQLYRGTLQNDNISFVDWTELQPGYYDAVSGTRDEDLMWTLSKAVYSPIRYTYGSGERSTWTGFFYTDRRESDNLVLDMYSNNLRYFDPEKPNAAVANLDIEHIFPKSWWGGEINEAYQDLHHLVPADYSANRSKSNLPPGIVETAGFDNGSFKTGTSPEGCPADKVFEPADEYKGDFARAYFYIACAFRSYTWDMTSNAAQAMDNDSYLEFQEWLYPILLQWHRMDPVSEKEIKRTAQVSRIQHNRNPFIDYPCLVEYIWGNRRGQVVDISKLLFTASNEYSYTADKSGCTCNCGVDVEQLSQPSPLDKVFAAKGTIYLMPDGSRVFSATGLDVTGLNGALPAGIYIITIGQHSKKILVY